MKRIFLAIFVFVSCVSFAQAQHLGTGTPTANISGGIASPNLGVGYSYIKSKWDVDDIKLGDVEISFGGFVTSLGDIDISSDGFEVSLGDIEPLLNKIKIGVSDIEFEQNQAYAQIGAVFGDTSTPNYEVFARIGFADFDADDGDFEGGTEPIYAVGMRTEFYQGQIFGIGGVFQASYIDSFHDSATYSFEGESLKVSQSIERIYDVELGIPVQAKAGDNALFYFGPVVYLTGADMDLKATDGIVSVSVDTEIEENKNVGVYGGLALRTGNMSFEVEGKYKSDFAVDALISFAF